jgi:hypothetical protein
MAVPINGDARKPVTGRRRRERNYANILLQEKGGDEFDPAGLLFNLLFFSSFFLVFVSLSRIIGGIKRRQQSTSENYRPLLMNCGAMQGQGIEAQRLPPKPTRSPARRGARSRKHAQENTGQILLH